MQNALRTFQHVRAHASFENDRLAHKHGLASADAPIFGLNIIHQQATISAELLDYYIGWSEDPANHTTDSARRRIEDNQRAITIGKASLVLSLSAAEAAAKSAIAERPGVLRAGKGRLYLSG